MDTPGNDASSVSGMIAGGCQIVIFTNSGLTFTEVSKLTDIPKVTLSPILQTLVDEKLFICWGYRSYGYNRVKDATNSW